MPFDPGSFVRLDSPQSLGASASGASFATSTGDILEVSCYGPGTLPAPRGPEHAAGLWAHPGQDARVHGRA